MLLVTLLANWTSKDLGLKRSTIKPLQEVRGSGRMKNERKTMRSNVPG